MLPAGPSLTTTLAALCEYADALATHRVAFAIQSAAR